MNYRTIGLLSLIIILAGINIYQFFTGQQLQEDESAYVSTIHKMSESLLLDKVVISEQEMQQHGEWVELFEQFGIPAKEGNIEYVKIPLDLPEAVALLPEGAKPKVLNFDETSMQIGYEIGSLSYNLYYYSYSQTFRKTVYIIMDQAEYMVGFHNDNNRELYPILTKTNSSPLENAQFQDGDEYVDKSMHEEISRFIKDYYAHQYSEFDQTFEVHQIYGTSTSQGITTIYMHSYFGGFNRVSGNQIQAGHSIPVVIRIASTLSGFKTVQYTEPKDGNLYNWSIENMFPDRYLNNVQQEIGVSELKDEMNQMVQSWLSQD